MIKKISTTKAPAAIGPYSQGIIAGDMLFASGQIPIDPATGEIHGNNITEQAEQVMPVTRNFCFMVSPQQGSELVSPPQGEGVLPGSIILQKCSLSRPKEKISPFCPVFGLPKDGGYSTIEKNDHHLVTE